jgi:hypothetical protein
MVGRHVRKREVEEGAEGQNGVIEPLGLDFGRAVGNGGGERWGEVVGQRIQDGDGVGTPGSRNARLAGVQAKNPQTSCRGSVWGWVRAPSRDGGWCGLTGPLAVVT